jgi:hypothetical protein
MRDLDSLHGVALQFVFFDNEIITSPDPLSRLPNHHHVVF